MVVWKGIAMVFGAVMVHLSLGTIYTFGNMAPYIASYYRNYLKHDIKLSDMTWIFSGLIACMGLCMTIGGILDRRIGTRLTAIIGCSIMCTGIFLTYLTINYSFPLLILTYGVMYGGGISLPYIALLSCGMRWFPEKRGLISGIIVAGFGMGTLIFNLVQTSYLNPNNLRPNKDGYFEDEELLKRVPNVFYILGAIYAGMQVIGCALANSPPPPPPPPEHTPAEAAPVLAKLTIQNTKGENGADAEANKTVELNLESVQITVPKHYTPLELLKTREFYLMWLTFFFNAQTANFCSSMYKIFGQTFISDDLFLAIVGSIGAVFNAAGRIGWGLLVDRLSYKNCLRIMLTGSLIFLLTMPATPLMGRYAFAFWMFIIQILIAASYVFFPAFTSKCFGSQYAGTNYGLVFSQMVVNGPTNGILTRSLLDSVGFTWIYFVLAGFTVTSLILTIPFREELYIPKKPKKPIAAPAPGAKLNRK
ncbi:hypothetical protein CHUAL_005252 [Chamberlinius hualienensis]